MVEGGGVHTYLAFFEKGGEQAASPALADDESGDVAVVFSSGGTADV